MTKDIAIKANLTPDKVDGNTGQIIETRPSVHEIAQSLKGYMEMKPKKVFFNGKRYPEYDDWQFIAQAYGLKVRTFDPTFVEIGGKKGFKAKASVLDEKQNEVGRAESFCMDDETNWKHKPLFQLASMAQTRAGAKALSNLFRPVALISGYEGTPAEEIVEEPTKKEIPFPGRPAEAYEPTPQEIDQAEEVMSDEVANRPPPTELEGLINKPEDVARVAKDWKKPLPPVQPREKKPGTISDKQGKLLYAKRKTSGMPNAVWKAWIKANLQVEDDRDIQWKDMDRCIQTIDRYIALD